MVSRDITWKFYHVIFMWNHIKTAPSGFYSEYLLLNVIINADNEERIIFWQYIQKKIYVL